MKKLLSIVALFVSLVGVNTAHAGIPVIDGANLAQAVQQVLSWAQQLQQMAAQLQQMQQTYNSLNGVRGMANLVNDVNARKYLPPEWQQTMNLMNSSGGQYGGISGSIASIKAAAKITDLADTGLDANSAAAKAFQASQNQAALNRAVGEEGYKQASQRIDSIQQLLNKVNDAPDQKDVLDLQARIQAEQAMLQNEQIKLALMTQLQQAQRDIAYQQAAEMRMKATKGDVPRF
jgi:type IV secretion system protein VirB5